MIHKDNFSMIRLGIRMIRPARTKMIRPQPIRIIRPGNIRAIHHSNMGSVIFRLWPGNIRMIRPGHIRHIRSNLVLVSSLVLPGRLHFVKKRQNRCILIKCVIFGLWQGHIHQIQPGSYSDNIEWRGSNLVLVSSLVLPGWFHFVKKKGKIVVS
jgi:hypothetical protein